MIPANEVDWRERYLDTLSCTIGDRAYWSLPKLAQDFQFTLSEQPLVARLFLENVMRHYPGETAAPLLIKALCAVRGASDQELELSYYPSRVLMQDYTGVPALADLAAMRDAVAEAGGDPQKINPSCPVDLVIDHSVIVDQAGNKGALSRNRQMEMMRNQERYQFLKWAQQSFANLTVVPPGRGICHQVNLEYFAQVVRDLDGTLIPDTLVGTDSHTTMINGLGVLGWGVGGIEAEAVMLGQPLSLNLPQIVGVKISGELPAGTTATDLVLTVTQRLRKHGVVGKFVEFYGPGLANLSVADRATIANMAPEYGATCGLFPIDKRVIEYLQLTNRPQHIIEQVAAYAVAQGLWHDDATADPLYAENITINLADIESSLAGPRRPQDRLPLSAIKAKTQEEIEILGHHFPVSQVAGQITDGDLVIAAITSCTNTSNPHVMLQAGLLAKAAVEKGLSVPAHVKTSLAPGSQVVARYLDDTGLQGYLDQLGFQRVGFGCTTCIGNSGPLLNDLETLIEQKNLSVAALLSGNRNFEGRIHPSVRLNWLASPPLVIAFALVGHTRIDLDAEPLGFDKNGQAVFLRDIWPSKTLLDQALQRVTQTQYKEAYQEMMLGTEEWENLTAENSLCYPWSQASTYIRKPPFFDIKAQPSAISCARILAVLGDSITTDHISPAGQINENSPAGLYLLSKQVKPEEFNSYGARRGNHEVMVRGTFANKRIKNTMVEPKEGGFTRLFDEARPAQSIVSIYDASQYYIQQHTPLVVFAGKEYGTGSSRDWAAKGCLLLNVKAVIAESFERIHRSNLVGMGILPLQLAEAITVNDLNLHGDETIGVEWGEQLIPRQFLKLMIRSSAAKTREVSVQLRIENKRELDYFLSGGVLRYVAKQY